MAQKTWVWILIAIGAVFLIGMLAQKSYQLFGITGTETMTRTGPTSANPSSTFTVTYTAVGVSGTWGATVVENIAGGCTINGKTALQFVMLSDLPNPLTYTVQAPSSGSCTFTGDYQFGNTSIKSFSNLIVSVCQPSCTGKQCGDDGCGGSCGTCQTGYLCTASGQQCIGNSGRVILVSVRNPISLSNMFNLGEKNIQIKLKADPNSQPYIGKLRLVCTATTNYFNVDLATPYTIYSSDGLINSNGIIPSSYNALGNHSCILINPETDRIISSEKMNIYIGNTVADTNYDGKVDRTELGAFITLWTNNQATRSDLGNAIMAWVGS